MFTFLNSAILAGLAAVAIPILIHLFTRQKSKIILFSTLRFLKELQQKHIRRLKIQQIFLLILRTLLILLLVLAFARPTLRSSVASSLESGARTTAVIILDNTLSMGIESQGRSLLQQARARAFEILNGLRRGDEIYLIYPQNPPKFAHDGPRFSVEPIKALIEETELTNTTTDFYGALALADEVIARSRNINKEAYLICDMQKAGLPKQTADGGTKILGEDVKLFVLPILAGEQENLNISQVSIANQIFETGKLVEIIARIHNSGKQTAENKLVHLFVNGKRVAQSAISLLPGETTEVIFKFIPDKPGFQSGYVMLEEDNLTQDNRRFFSFYIPVRIPVLLVGQRPEDSRYINLALSPDKKAAGAAIKVSQVAYRDFQDMDLSQFQVLTFSNLAEFDFATVLKLGKFVKAGGGLLVFLGGNVDLRNYNEGLHKRFKLPALLEMMHPYRSDQVLSFGEIDFSHPIFTGVFEDKEQIESPHFGFAFKVMPDISIDSIIKYSDGSPFLFEAQHGTGRIMYVTAGVSPDRSDLVTRGVFAPLINRCVRYLAGTTAQNDRSVLINEEVTHLPAGLESGASLTVEMPDQTQNRIKPEVERGHYAIRFTGTAQPGVYRLKSGEQVLSQWTVNVDPVESDIDILETKDFADEIHRPDLVTISENENIARVVEGSRYGRELWHWLIAVALLVMITEMILVRARASKPL